MSLAQPRPAGFDQAACAGADPDLFFPERGESLREAREVCRSCPVREDCLDYAIDHVEKSGVCWAGKVSGSGEGCGGQSVWSRNFVPSVRVRNRPSWVHAA